ncbi:MAG TPA: tRNA (guanosine(37)-N1)-methyltransferase TrmD [Gammaproteobacteria bacterium]|jgi:tRNA (guanine37-N1)-methyltransferase|nr:tRNA (guanosine(37)-N1)-methyltransferase TrmD [Gammaproteobacteria bacterium]
MRIDVVTLFPDLVRQVAECGVTGRAVQRELLALHTWNPRDYTHDRHRTVDDRPYGGGPGMVMRYEPLRDVIRAARAESPQVPVVYLSPQGRLLTQEQVRIWASGPGLILLAGRYEGIDERLHADLIDEEWSIGDYVLSGGELAAMVVIDAVARLQPGALGDEDSAEQDSFSQGLLDCPHFTRPESIDGMDVPPVLMGGNHADIVRWRSKQSLGRTWQRRPELLDHLQLTQEQQLLLDEFIQEQDDKRQDTPQ